MKPPRFDLVMAESLDEALSCLSAEAGQARIMAGGQSLMAMLNMRLASPAVIIDISRIAELDYLREDGGMLEIGAATTQATLLAWPPLADRLPLLSLALPHVGHFQTRNRGTVCGSLAHADPSAELALALALLGGEVVLRRRGARRVLGAAEFQTGMLSTACRPDEMLVAARFPLRKPGEGHSFREIARRHGDFAIVGCAALARGSETRLAVSGVADRPVVRRFDGLEGDALDAALDMLAWDLEASDDIHASARYRREMVRRLGRQTIEEARHAALGA